MVENQNNNQNQPRKKSGNKIIATAAIVGVVGGLVGGGVSYYAMEQMNNGQGNGAAQTSISSSSSKVSEKSAKNGGTMTAAYNDVKGAVVSVINLKRQSTSSGTDSLYNSLFGDDSDSSSSKNGKLETYSEGSGVVYMKSNGKGYIVTNNHVISGSDAVQVLLANGKTVNAKVVGKDSTTDLAVLSIDAKYVTQTAQFGDSKHLEAGQTVIAVGSPLGSEYASTVTQGIISAPARTISTSSGNQQTVIQTDAAINPGNSGGALIDVAGNLIGVNTAIFSQSGGSLGIGFAIPAQVCQQVLNSILKDGRVVRGWLGISLLPPTQDDVLAPKQQVGVVVADVLKNGPADAAGIKVGDKIVQVNNEPITSASHLINYVALQAPNSEINVLVEREGKQQNYVVTVGERKAQNTQSQYIPLPRR